jgi:hypothetical protein
MILANGRRMGSKVERKVECGVSCSLHHNELGHRQNMLVFPNMQVPKLEHFLLELSA